jgi:hypothetical protein
MHCPAWAEKLYVLPITEADEQSSTDFLTIFITYQVNILQQKGIPATFLYRFLLNSNNIRLITGQTINIKELFVDMIGCTASRQLIAFLQYKGEQIPSEIGTAMNQVCEIFDVITQIFRQTNFQIKVCWLFAKISQKIGSIHLQKIGRQLPDFFVIIWSDTDKQSIELWDQDLPVDLDCYKTALKLMLGLWSVIESGGPTAAFPTVNAALLPAFRSPTTLLKFEAAATDHLKVHCPYWNDENAQMTYMCPPIFYYDNAETRETSSKPPNSWAKDDAERVLYDAIESYGWTRKTPMICFRSFCIDNRKRLHLEKISFDRLYF